jgi:hypothetical protein
MGRPIKKSYIGNIDNPGYQIACNAWIPGDTGPSLCWIKEQTGTGRYVVSRDDDTLEGVVTLANAGPDDLIEGQASLTFELFPSSGGGEKYVEVIYNNIVRTFDGKKYIWYFSDISDTGEVNAGVIQSL